MRASLRFLACSTLLIAAACSGSADQDAPERAPIADPSAPAATAPPTGTIIEIEMYTNDKGNYFEPAEITAKAGDLLRFKLVQGVHNVHFLPDSNPGSKGLPSATGYAQLPGQALDVPLTFGSGRFYFQCDPHAMLGMVGRVTVSAP